jgi:hypothetical protein
MRRLVTGVNEAGRSCIVEDSLIVAQEASEGHNAVSIYTTDSAPPESSVTGNAAFYDLGLPAGFLNWQIVEHKPNMVAPMHETQTVDFDLVLEGSTELGLGDGMHRLEPGDCVVITGVAHSWKAGPTGCRLSVTSIGTKEA